MTDLHKTKELFQELGIGYRETQFEGTWRLELLVEVGERKREKITGYPCFCADFAFDEEGKFIEVVIGE